MSKQAEPGSLSDHTTHPENYEFSIQEVRQILEGLPHWFWAKNRDGEFMLCNEKFAREAYGTTREEILGTTDLDWVDIDIEEEKFRADDFEVMDTGEKKIVPQERLTSPDGTEYVVKTMKFPFESDITEQDATFGFAIDIRDRLDTDRLVGVHEATQEFISAESEAEVGELAVETSTEVLDLDYCTVWVADESTDRLELLRWSREVERNASVRDLDSVTAGPGDSQWERFHEQHSAIETEMQEEVDPRAANLPVDEPLSSLIVLPIGDYGLLEVGSFDRDLFKDDLAKIVASSMETAFGRLERERELRELSRQVEETVSEVVDSTDSVADMTQTINSQADQQVETMTSVAEAVTTLSAQIEEIASTADEVESTSVQASDLATDGRESAEDAKEAIDAITDSVDRVETNVESLQNHVEEIDTIVEVINDITEQTNILALNASIEAANADSSGDAFEVVANEVKALASESKEHASEIETLIENVQENTDETAESLEEMIDLVGQGNDRIDRTMQKLREITSSIEDASNGISEVARATDDQAASTEEMAAQIDDATEIAKEVAEQIEQVAGTNEAITSEVSELQSAVARLADSR